MQQRKRNWESGEWFGGKGGGGGGLKGMKKERSKGKKEETVSVKKLVSQFKFKQNLLNKSNRDVWFCYRPSMLWKNISGSPNKRNVKCKLWFVVCWLLGNSDKKQ